MTIATLFIVNMSIFATFQPISIANKIAGSGAPNCVEYRQDGSEAPCLPTFRFNSRTSINAKTVGNEITFNLGAATRLTNDEFAILAGHEIAHYYLGHRKESKNAELEADKLAAELACSAGFDPLRGISVFRFVHESRSHPPKRERIKVIESVKCALNSSDFR